MKIVLYGGGFEDENKPLNKAALSLTEKTSPRLAYIPACSYEAEIDFRYFVDHFKKQKIKKFLYFPIDTPFDKFTLKMALKSDLIHLSGGNTYYFLNYLRKTGMLKLLKEFVQRGGVLTGLSAGAIVTTPCIETAGFPPFDRDDNDENLKNLKAMKLVDFEFFPHYKNSKRYDESLLKYSKKTKYPIYACPDGSGIVVNDGALQFMGRSYCFYKGKKMKVSAQKTS